MIHLTRDERLALEQDARRRGLSFGVVIRPRIILALADDPCVSAVAQRLQVDRKTVRHWRDRYLCGGRAGLETRPIPGRPVRIEAVSRCQLIALACGKPGDFGVAHRHLWTTDSLLRTYRQRHPDLAPLSRGSLFRILNQAELRPHRMRLWLHSPDPKFREKVTEICGCYLQPEAGHVYLCVDEKSGMQALGRRFPIRRAAPRRAGRFEYEYVRHGTRTLMAAFNPHTAEVVGQVGPTRTAEDVVAFMERLATLYPREQVHIIWDNLNIHHDGPSKRWTSFNQRHGGRFQFHYTPIHASWVNQVELFFGLVQRRVLRYGVFNSPEELEAAVMGFIDLWNAHERHPFRWAFKGYPTQEDQGVKPSSRRPTQG